MPKLGFKGRSERDIQQQKREFYYLLDRMENAPTREEEEKWRTKMEKWMNAHPYTKEKFDEIAEKWVKENPKKLMKEAKRRGMI